MLGAIAGDIIGSVYEHANVKTKNFPLFKKESWFTDDTVMSLALADALVHERDFAQNFRRFYNWYPRAGYGNMFKAWATDTNRKAYQSFGNGSAMRVSAVSYAFEKAEDVLDFAKKSAAVSHDHPEGILGAEVIALATFLARKGYEKADILNAVADHSGYDITFSLNDIRDDYHFDATCQGSVPQVLVAFREGQNFEDVLRSAISIGGDSDTIACMAGSIAGAFYKIPEEIDLETRRRLDDRLLGVLRLFEEKYGIEK